MIPIWVAGTSEPCREGEHHACENGACLCPCHVPFAGHPEPLCLATDEDPFCHRHPWSLVHVDAFSDGGVLWSELQRLDGGPVHALPPSPLCARCEHQLCPSCPLAWCDRVTDCVCWEEHDGECLVAAEDWKAWSAQLARCRLSDDRVGHHGVAVQDGPWWSWKERQ